MIDLVSVIKVFLKNLKYNDDYSEQSSASTRAYTMCVPNCISVEEDENYTDDSYPNPDFEILDEFDETEVEEELKQLEKYKTKYETLESEIGCSPEVFFKLHRYGRIFDLHDNCYYYITNITNLYIETECEREGFKGIYFIAEYMGSWCLKEDRSE